jgi:hypothetical protein
MYLNEQQLYASIGLAFALLLLIVRLVQNGRLDIAYSWLWLTIGAGILIVAIRYDIISRISAIIGSLTNSTTVFMLGFFVVLLMCLQFSLVISTHRRQLKKLTQDMAILQAELDKANKPAGQKSGS